MIEKYNTQIIANDNKVANPTFNRGTNLYTLTGTLVGTNTNDGLQLDLVGTLYQKLGADVVETIPQVALVYVYSITGTATLKIGTTVGASDLGSKTLVAGWNTLSFTAGATNYLTIDQASGTTVIVEMNVCATEDLIISGNLTVGSGVVLPSTIPLGTTWRIRVDSNTLNFEYSTDNFATSIVAQTFIAE